MRVAGEVATMVSCEMVVELGETNLWVSLDQDGATSRPDLVEGAQPGQFPADLRVSAAGRWYWDTGHPLRDGDLLVSNVLARVDDPVPVIIGRESVSGAELVAWQVATVVRLTNADGPARLTVVHPVDLSRRGRAAVERHLSRQLPVGTQVVWVSRAAAAVAATPECVDLAPRDRVGILHVGGSSVEAAVWRRTETAGDVVAVRADRGGAGHAVDDALLSAMSRGTGFGRPAGWSPVDLPGLRSECERAKVALSAETAVDVDVEGVPVRMVRGDVEELSAPLVMRQLDTLGAVLARSDDDGSPLRMILLVGGAAAAPSLVEAAGARFDVPVVAVPRLGDVFASRAATAIPDLAGIGSPAADQQAARGTAPAPIPTPDDTSSAAVLARARHRWTPMVPLTAATTVAGSAPRPAPQVSRKSMATPSSDRGSHPSPIAAAASARPGTRLARIPVPRPTHLAVAAAVLIAIAAVPAIGGAMKDAGDPTTLATPRSGNATVAGAASGIFGGGGLAFTPGAGSAGPSVSQWLSNPTGTLGPNQLLSMVRPAAAEASPSSTSSTAGADPAAVAAGTAPAAAPAGGSTPAAGTQPAGTGSTPASTTPPASTPPASNPPASNPPASDPPATNPPASDPPASDPPASDPPASDPPASDPPATDPPAPEPTNDPGPQSTPDPEPSNPEPVIEATLAGDGSGGGGGTEVGDGSDGSTAP